MYFMTSLCMLLGNFPAVPIPAKKCKSGRLHSKGCISATALWASSWAYWIDILPQAQSLRSLVANWLGAGFAESLATAAWILFLGPVLGLLFGRANSSSMASIGNGQHQNFKNGTQHAACLLTCEESNLSNVSSLFEPFDNTCFFFFFVSLFHLYFWVT